jgi:hypothetical protein
VSRPPLPIRGLINDDPNITNSNTNSTTTYTANTNTTTTYTNTNSTNTNCINTNTNTTTTTYTTNPTALLTPALTSPITGMRLHGVSPE